jgi:uroporphyrinogen-III synthase
MTGRLPLEGRTVLVTRERPGEIATLLTSVGARVEHVPLIAVVEPDDGGRSLDEALAELDRYDWLVVTSAAGAARVAAAAGRHPAVRLAAVGTSTAATLAAGAGRDVEVVPAVQQAAALAGALVERATPGDRLLVALGDRASPALAASLAAAGLHVDVRTAYRTIDLVPTGPPPAADATVFLSGSSVESWVRAYGPDAPGVVVAIGPSTAAIAAKLFLKVDAVAADQSLAGVVDELVARLAQSARPS